MRQQSDLDTPPPSSGIRRLAGLFYAPRRVFEELSIYPSWWAGVVAITLILGAYDLLAIQRFGADEIARAVIEQLGLSGLIAIDSAIARWGWPFAHLGVIFPGFAVLATLLRSLASVFGGRLSYSHAISVAIYAALPSMVIDRLISALLLFIKPINELDPLDAIIGLTRLDLRFLFAPAEHLYLHVLAASLSLVALYRMRLQALGLRYAGHQITSISSWMIVFLVWLIGALLCVTAARLFPAVLF